MYLDVGDLKKTLSLQGLSYADLDIEQSILAASEAIDDVCNRTFTITDGSNDDVRIYTPHANHAVEVDDIAFITSVEVDRGDGTWSEEWTATDYMPWPLNAEAKGRPWEELRATGSANRWFPAGRLGAVRVTGRFGWLTVPNVIITCASIIAVQYLRRIRDAPFGIVTVGGIDQAVAARIARTDPNVGPALKPFTREVLIA
jgi:hypothetical protein